MKKPKLALYLETNKKFGCGYQVRMTMEGIIDSVFDGSPMVLQEAYSHATVGVEAINEDTGYDYDPRMIIYVSGEALETNKNYDVMSARFYNDQKESDGELSECATMDVEGKQEVCLTGCGTVLVIFFAWLDEKLPKAKIALMRYCQYLAMHGYGKNASGVWSELERMDKDNGASWIRSTHDEYCKDDVTLINYMMQTN